MNMNKYLVFLNSRNRGRVLLVIVDNRDEALSIAKHLASYYECFIDDIALIEEINADALDDSMVPEFASSKELRRSYWY